MVQRQQKQWQQQPTPIEKTTKFEDTFQQFMKMSVSCCKNVEAAFNSMKMHIGQLVNKMEGCEKNAKGNLREECKTIVTRSGKVLEERKIERKEKENESGKETLEWKERVEKKKREEVDERKKEREKEEVDERKKEREKEEVDERKKERDFEKPLPYPKIYSRKEKEKQLERFYFKAKETLSVELVKYCYGDRGIAGSSLVCLRKCSEEEVILREVFGGSVSSFVKIQRRCCFISCGIKRGVF
ncbi:hypothetical protein LR48_Vigan125s001200 [Vigna angularis]|uniref:Uncharacterized protein n=1 Tax=Phaseolus angularis TaxID=3914 RepID=A0A0L9T4W8_PHAAN|nr:hypothetical protein LR48_Vigan125s001200 [Vigna angularis]